MTKIIRNFVSWLAAVFIFLCCIGNFGTAQTMDIPIKNQLVLFAKILTCDRNYPQRISNQMVIGIIYQKTFRSSSAAKDDFLSIWEISDGKILGENPSRYELIDVSTVDDLGKELDRLDINLMYITPLRAYNLEKILSASRSRKILTLTGVDRYVTEGLAVGIGIKNDRPQITINLSSAKAEGADFTSNFLKLTRVIP